MVSNSLLLSYQLLIKIPCMHYLNTNLINMTTLIFKNKKLQGLLNITEQATVFRASYSEAIEAYEKDTNRSYDYEANLDKYYEHNSPTLWLVKDEGIYLMASAKLKEYPNDNSHICYAEGFEPNNPGCWDLCRAAVGGDDFVESFKFSEQLKKGIKQGADIHISITTKNFIIELVYAK